MLSHQSSIFHPLGGVYVLLCSVHCSTSLRMSYSVPKLQLLFIPLILTHFLFDILPVTKAANPTDVFTGVKLAKAHLIFFSVSFLFCSNWDFSCARYKRTPRENFSFFNCWTENKVLVPWRARSWYVCTLTEKTSAICQL